MCMCCLQHMSFAYFPAGETIFRQGDTGEHFYIILSGIVDVLVNDGGPDSVCLSPTQLAKQTDTIVPILKLTHLSQEDKTVAHLMAGASFGELALMQVSCCLCVSW